MPIPKVVVIGSLNMDIVVETRQIPQIGETLLGDRVRFIPGGKGANQAVAAARLGAVTSMIGAVGTDAFGDELLAVLSRDGVDVGGVKRLPDAATGIASIYVADGDNSIVVVPGANERVTPADIDRHADKLEQADIVLLQLEIPVETVLYAARTAKNAGQESDLEPRPGAGTSAGAIRLPRLYDAQPHRTWSVRRDGVDHGQRFPPIGDAAAEGLGGGPGRNNAGRRRIGLLG
ncbi:hypothetical protein HMSSN139_58300 [Paenibacillus sp. HMSSN-139]|nr:hypothetical protein HMSSN139_58300 [Paenibacillus sp. HMSSN-139]